MDTGLARYLATRAAQYELYAESARAQGDILHADALDRLARAYKDDLRERLREQEY
jgi:hypothetical protein